MVMTSYNLVNGVRMSENQHLIDILRKDFGFDGVIVSDWEAYAALDCHHGRHDDDLPLQRGTRTGA